MPLINLNTPPQPTPVQSTQKLMANAATEAFASLVKAYNKGMGLVWQNPFGLTPQEVLDSYGPDAAKVLQLAGLNLQTIMQVSAIEGFPIDPATLATTPDGTTLTANADGTVTVTGWTAPA